jgi:pimeloyl-ACP methyl ester carboxylesterase
MRNVIVSPHGLPGILRAPVGAVGLVVFAHGSGSSRLSPRNNAVADAFAGHGLATLLFDLLTDAEEADRENVFDIPLLADRLIEAIDWSRRQRDIASLPLGLFGASTGAAAALVAAARLGEGVRAVVSRGGRPDLAGDALARVVAPTLLIVGGADIDVIELNRRAASALRSPHRLQIIPGATHLFPEPGALDQVVDHAVDWFKQHLPGRGAGAWGSDGGRGRDDQSE